ncbi:MAG: DUF4395 domain-containing protein [Firmicutes bacterium]|nr:DUF4395 domain-containing protein [Bacillota bacterium]
MTSLVIFTLEVPMGKSGSIFGFPETVNEVAARTVAGGVVLMAVGFCATGNRLLLGLLCYGFLARVTSGPKFSPLGRFATKIIAPRMSRFSRIVPGKPKRFAQGIGAVFTSAALILAGLGFLQASVVLIAILAFFASMEAVLAFCVGCQLFALLMKVGVLNSDYCRECADISLHSLSR